MAARRRRDGGAQRAGDERVHADVLALGLGEHGLVQVVGNRGSERRHGCVDNMRRNSRGGKTVPWELDSDPAASMFRP